MTHFTVRHIIYIRKKLKEVVAMEETYAKLEQEFEETYPSGATHEEIQLFCNARTFLKCTKRRAQFMKRLFSTKD